LCAGSPVPLDISGKLLHPELWTGGRNLRKLAVRMLVPEAPVHEYRHFPFREDDVGCSWKILTMEPKPETRSE
jgi:hypothetical protein